MANTQRGGHMAGFRGRRDSSEQDKKFQFRFLIPVKAANIIIGKSGERIQRLRLECNSRLSIPDNKGPERVFLIDGSFENCIKVLADCFPDLKEVMGNKNNEEMDLRFLCHNSIVGAIIGKGGTRVKELRATYQLSLIKVHVDMAPMSTDRVIQIVGAADKIFGCLKIMFAELETQNVRGPIDNYNPDNFDEQLAQTYGGWKGESGWQYAMSQGDSGMGGYDQAATGGYGDQGMDQYGVGGNRPPPMNSYDNNRPPGPPMNPYGSGRPGMPITDQYDQGRNSGPPMNQYGRNAAPAMDPYGGAATPMNQYGSARGMDQYDHETGMGPSGNQYDMGRSAAPSINQYGSQRSAMPSIDAYDNGRSAAPPMNQYGSGRGGGPQMNQYGSNRMDEYDTGANPAMHQYSSGRPGGPAMNQYDQGRPMGPGGRGGGPTNHYDRGRNAMGGGGGGRNVVDSAGRTIVPLMDQTYPDDKFRAPPGGADSRNARGGMRRPFPDDRSRPVTEVKKLRGWSENEDCNDTVPSQNHCAVADNVDISIPSSYLSALQGVGGEKLSNIMKDSGADIMVVLSGHDNSGKADTVITVKGTKDQIEGAQYLMQMCMKRCMLNLTHG